MRREFFSRSFWACIYVFLTVATTSGCPNCGYQLHSSQACPIINSEIPIVGFYWAAPLILAERLPLFSFVFAAALGVFGQAARRVPRWNATRRKGLPMATEQPGEFSLRPAKESDARFFRDCSRSVSIALVYWIVPLTLVFVWGRYLTRQEWAGTGVHIAAAGDQRLSQRGHVPPPGGRNARRQGKRTFPRVEQSFTGNRNPPSRLPRGCDRRSVLDVVLWSFSRRERPRRGSGGRGNVSDSTRLRTSKEKRPGTV